MANGNGISRTNDLPMGGRGDSVADGRVTPCNHPAWLAFVRYCQELRHGQIECLKIQDGLPVLAEVTTKKVKFT